MSRAYEELGNVEEAMTVMNRFVKEHPDSKYFDEVQFRRLTSYNVCYTKLLRVANTTTWISTRPRQQ